MRKTGQSPSLTQLSLLSPSPQECKKEKKEKTNYVGMQCWFFYVFLEKKKKTKTKYNPV